MKIRRQITGALCGLLDTYGSRYSDYDGYWIFGLLVREADSFSFDLLREESAPALSPVVAEARLLARTKFQEQLQRAHIPAECVSEAKLTIQKIGGSKIGPVSGHLLHGHQVSLVAEAISDLGKKYRSEKFVFVAPHDPCVEHRSIRRQPNQALLPTSMSVTDRACARSAPDTLAADL
jgi:hypothetical protein